MDSNPFRIDYEAIARVCGLRSSDWPAFVELCESTDLSNVSPAVNVLLDRMPTELKIAAAYREALFATGRRAPEGEEEKAYDFARIMQKHDVPSEYRGPLVRFCLTCEGDYRVGDAMRIPEAFKAMEEVREKYFEPELEAYHQWLTDQDTLPMGQATVDEASLPFAKLYR